MTPTPAIICQAPAVSDGDSIRCRNLGRIRLIGIDAADRTDSYPCRRHIGDHVCNNAQAASAKAMLKRGLRGRITVQRVPEAGENGYDQYGRMLAIVRANGVNMSCFQIRQGVARYMVRYDTGGVIASECR